MAFIETIPVSRARANPELKAAYEVLAEHLGSTRAPNVMQAFTLRPDALVSTTRAWEVSQWIGDAPRTDTEFLAACVSHLNGCTYCADSHEAFLQAVGGQASRVLDVLEDRVTATPLEASLVKLAKAGAYAVGSLSPQTLAPLRDLTTESVALQHAQVMSQYHFINRVVDLVGVAPEFPPALRRVDWIRRAVLRAMSVLLSRMRSDSRRFQDDPANVLSDVSSALQRLSGASFEDSLRPLVEPRPEILVTIRLGVDLLERSQLDAKLTRRIFDVVSDALPKTEDDVVGLHPRPSDPVDAFAFVGTRYASRSTQALVDSVRAAGYDDRQVLDVAITIAVANQWARLFPVIGAAAPAPLAVD